MDPQQQLASAYDYGTFGVSRRTFFKLAAAGGIAAAGGMLIFPGQDADAAFTKPESSSWPDFSAQKIRFTVQSDTHVGASKNNNYSEKISEAFSALYAMAPRLDAHFFVGDSADTGHPDQYAELAQLLNAQARKPVGIVMGNHEYYHWSGNKQNAQSAFASFLSSHLEVAGSFQIPDGPNDGQVDADFVVGGYHVIAAAPDPGGYDNSWYGAKRDWILERCAAAAAEDPAKPIFLLTHHPFPDTVWHSGSSSWTGQFDENGSTAQSGAFYRTLCEKYPQVIHFSGHTHIPLADPRSIYQDDGFTLIQTATFANNFWMEDNGYDETGSASGHPAAGEDANQCELVEIDPATHIVSVYRLDFRIGAALGAPWIIDPAKGTEGFRYTHADMAARSRPPVVLEDGTVTVPDDLITASGASFSIAVANVMPDATGLEDDLVMSYRVEVCADAADANVYDARFMSDYYKAAVNRADVFTRPLFGAALIEDTAYVLRAFAANSFGKETLIGEVPFRTAVRVTPGAGELLLAVDFSTGNHADASPLQHQATPTGTLTYEHDTFGIPVAVFDGSSAVGYDFTADDYAAIAQAETIEALFQFTANPSDGYFDLFSSAQGAGQDLSYYAPLLQHYVNVGGGYRCTEALVPLNSWTHVLVTYDGKTMKYYLDGELVSTQENPGVIPAPTATTPRWFVGADVNAAGEMEKPMVGKVAFAKLTCGVATEAQAADLYAASAPVRDAIAPPPADEIGGGTVGAPYTIPTLLFEDNRGKMLQAVPAAFDPNGTSVEMIKASPAKASPDAQATYRFTPVVAGTHTITYRAGYAQRPSFDLIVSNVAVDPKPEPTPLPTPDSPGSDPGESPGTQQGELIQETVPFASTAQKLARTGEPFDAGGILVGAAAVAGAALCVARGFLRDIVSAKDPS